MFLINYRRIRTPHRTVVSDNNMSEEDDFNRASVFYTVGSYNVNTEPVENRIKSR